MEQGFDKHYLKKDHGTGRVLIEDGNPVIGDLIKPDCRLEQRHVNILNRNWKKSGVYFVSSKEQDEANKKAEAEKQRLLDVDITAKENADKIEDQRLENERLKKEAEDKETERLKTEKDHKAEIEKLKGELVLSNKNPVIKKSEDRLKLEAEAKELDVSFRADISDEKLIERINENKK